MISMAFIGKTSSLVYQVRMYSGETGHDRDDYWREEVISSLMALSLPLSHTQFLSCSNETIRRFSCVGSFIHCRPSFLRRRRR